MSFQAMAAAMKIRTGDAAANHVLLVLANYCGDDGKAWPTQERLAEDTGLSLRTVKAKLLWLVERGFLGLEKFRDGESTRNRYIFHGAIGEFHGANDGNAECKSRTLENSMVQNLHFHGATVAPKPIIEPITDVVVSVRADLNQLEHDLRKAAGLTDSPAPGLFDLSPILELRKAGFDLETEILPAIRSRPNSRASTWRYFVPQIKQSKADALAAANAPLPPARAGPAPRQRHETPAEIGKRMLAELEDEQTGSNSGDHGNLVRLPFGGVGGS